MDVGQVQGMGEFSLPRIPRMRHQVDLAEPGRCHIPTIGLHRDVMLQQRAGLGAPVNTPFALALLRLQSPVDLPCTDAQQLFLHLRGHPVALANPGHPAGQQGLQPHPTRDSPRLPRSPPRWTAVAGHSAAGVPAAAAPVVFQEEVHSEAESRISGGSRCSGKIRSASSASLRAQLCDNVRRPHENIPTSPCVPIYPPQNRLLSRVTSYVSRRPLPRLHLAWLDTLPRKYAVHNLQSESCPLRPTGPTASSASCPRPNCICTSRAPLMPLPCSNLNIATGG